MKNTKAFSIIEMLTVVFIILLLMTLIAPSFTRLKMNARNTLCRSQLKQLHTLITSYSTDHDGRLPNDLITDIPPSYVKVGSNTVTLNNGLYRDWTGHLLPYINAGIKSYQRTSKLRKDGKVYTYDYVYGLNNGTTEPADQLDGAWIVINDAYHKGGFNELKTFICPEIHTNTFDVGVSNDFNGLKIPRVSELAHWQGFTDLGHNYLGGGIPTTYLANDIFFGFDGPWMAPQQSLRPDQIPMMSKKALVIEGGLGWAKGTNGEPGYVYYRISKGDLALNGLNKNATGGHKLNYVHDTGEPYWVMNCQLYQYFPSFWMNWNDKRELAEKFNIAFAGKAAMVEGDYGYSIVSYIDPADKPFDAFFAKNPPGVALLPFEAFHESEFHYLTGNMNIMFGDSSVLTKDQGWLSTNRTFIGQITHE